MSYGGRVLLAFNKPYGVLSQFTSDGSKNRILAEFGFPRNVYPLGRLDADSEGLLLLTDEASLNTLLLHPCQRHSREYWVQVERIPTDESLARLSRGLVIQGRATQPCRACRLGVEPPFPPRNPPIRLRKTVPTCWLSLVLGEGRNRQVRRMTAAVGHPTLRLVRVAIGKFHPQDIPCGSWREMTQKEQGLIFAHHSHPIGGKDCG